MKRPLVSVCCITYNHERYIEQAIRGFLLQKTTFPIEIIVGDDASTDKTVKIIRRLAKGRSHIRVLTTRKNMGMCRNFKRVLEKARGTYIALCEGDDYWTNQLKLQKQVNYLEAHPNCAICFHDATIYDQNHPQNKRRLARNLKGNVFTTKDLLLSNMVPTLTCVFRNQYLKPLPVWFLDVFPADWPLHIYNSLHGYAYYMNENMAVYRVHDKSIIHTLANEYKYKKLIKMMKAVRQKCVAKKDYTYADMSISNMECDLADYYCREGRRRQAWQHWLASIKTSCSLFTLKKQFVVFIKLCKSYFGAEL